MLIADDVLIDVIVVLQRYSLGITRVAVEALGLGEPSNRNVEAFLAIHARPGTTPSELAEVTGVRASAASRAVSRLVDEGLVQRRVSGLDRRSVTLRLTGTGRARVRRFDQQMRDFNESCAPKFKELLLAFGREPVAPEGAVRPAALVTAGRLAELGTRYAEDADSVLATFGLTTRHERFAICFLRASGRMIPSQLADELGVAGSTVTALLDCLDDLGLVAREHPNRDGDRRTVQVTLTRKGRRAADAFLPLFHRHTPDALDVFALTLAPEAR